MSKSPATHAFTMNRHFVAQGLMRERAGQKKRPRIERLEERSLLTVFALSDSFGAVENSPLNVSASGVLANDYDNTATPLHVSAFTQPSHGTLSMNSDGTFVYTPATNFGGADSFSYTAADGVGGTASASVSLNVDSTGQGEAYLFAGPRLASVNSTQSTLLNSLLGGLTGSTLNLTAVDWTGLSQTQLNGGAVASALQAELGVSSPSQALTTNATLSQLYTAEATVAQANGDTAEATALNGLSASVSGLTNKVQLGNLLNINPNDGSLAQSSLNALDLVTGEAELYNYSNVATTPTPVTISGSALGLPTSVGTVTLQAQVVEPPIITGGFAGTQFHSAAIRLKMNISLSNDTLNLSALNTALASILGAGTSVQSTGSLTNLTVYTEVAEGQGTITSVNAISDAVNLQATPGLANVYIGNIADSVFFNRNHVLNAATDLTYGNVGNLAISTTLLGVPVLNASTGIQLKTNGQGDAPFATNETFNPPYPETQTVTTSASFISNLTTTLVNNLSVQLSGSLGAVLDPLVNSTILPAVKTAVSTAVPAVVTPVLTNVADPSLQLLGTGIGELVLTVTGVAQILAPIANTDYAVTPENTPVIVMPLANDASTTGDVLSITSTTNPAHGQVSIGANNAVTYTPSTGYFGADAFTYTLTDSSGLTSTATVNVNVQAPPIAANDAYTVTENTALTVSAPGVLANDTDPAGQPLSSSLVSQPSHGTLTFNADGSFVYTPTSGYFGSDSFTYRDNDGTLNSNTATVALTIQQAAPVATNDAYTVTENTPLTVSAPGVLANDTDPSSLPLTALVVSNPTHGTLALNANGSFTYTPTSGYSGSDSFTYRANDGNLNSNTATVTLTIPRGAPVATNDVYTATENTPLTIAAPGILANDTDPSNLSLTPTVVSNPTHGTLALNANGSFTYTPTSGYFGSDSFTYRDNDGTLNSNTATVSLTIPQGAPVATNDAYTASESSPLTVSAPGVLANDTDPSLLPLTAAVVSNPTHGTLTLNANGSFTYTPTSGYFGSDSFTYRANDGTLNSNTATVTLTIQQGGPVATNDAYTANENTALTVSAPGVLANDTDPSGLTLTSSIVTSPTHGTLSLSSNGSFVYTPTSGYFGSDSFTYRDNDGTLNSNTATVALTIQQGAPVATNDAYTSSENNPLTVVAPGVLANDTDPSSLPLTAIIVSNPTHGTLALNANGSFTYTPTPGYFGSDSFTYRANDGNLNSNTATVALTIQQGAPVATNDAYTASENSPLAITAPGVLANDSDPSGLPLTAAVVTPPTHGTLSLASNGSFTYTPTSGYFGSDSFTYRSNDGNLNSNTATVALTVQQGAPAASNDSYSAFENTTLAVSAPGVLANDTDPSGLTLTATEVSAPIHGTLVLNSDGSFSYVPTHGYFGPDSFSYRASDGTLNSNTAIVNLNVQQGAPTAVNDTYSATENAPLTVILPGVLANDSDPSSLPLTATLVTGPTHGTLTFLPNGSFLYLPTTGYFGTDSFTYKASDGVLLSAPATVTLNIAQAPPVAINDVFSTTEGAALTVAAPGVLVNDTDPSSLPLTAAVITGPTHGTLALNANGSYTYNPSAGFVGTDSFTYHDSDGALSSNTATVTIVVSLAAEPIAVPDAYGVAEDGTLAVTAPGVLANDTDFAGLPLTASVVTAPTHGTLTLNSNGSFTYTPTNGYFGPDSFTYQAGDGIQTSAPAAVVIAVTQIAPVALPDTYSATEGNTLNVVAPGVLSNDTDPSGLPLSAVLVSGTTHGLVTLDPDGSFSYSPNAGTFGTDSFTYRATDGTLSSNTVTVTLNVQQGAPVANNDLYFASEGTLLSVVAPGVLANDVDPNGYALTAALLTGPTHGALTLNANGSFTYLPTSGYSGPDSFTYRSNDGTLNSAAATVNLTVLPVAPPVAVADTYNGTENTTLIIPAAGVLSNDLDPSGQPLTAIVQSNPSHGTLTLNANGSFTYVPVANYVGADSFTYSNSDGINSSNTATVSLNIVSSTSTTPIANDDSYNATANTTLTITAPGVLGNDVDPSGQPLTSVLATAPTHGALTLNSDGSFTYIPAAGYTGGDTFTYTATDGTYTSSPATVTINVQPSTAPPVANPDLATVPENSVLTVSAPGVLSNDTSPSGGALSAFLVSNPTHGTLVFNADGSYTYTPAANYVGSDSFNYRDSDGSNFGNTTTVTITVSSVALPPLATVDSYTLTENNVLTVSAPGVIGNDFAPSGQPLTSALVSGPSHGTLTFNTDGSFTYIPNPGYVGLDSFFYKDSDGTLNSNTAPVNLTINASPLSPTANPDSYTTTAGSTLAVVAPGVLANDTDPNSLPLAAALVSAPSHGTLIFNANGSFNYVPNAGYVGSDSFSYRDSDGLALSNPTVVTLTINPAPLPPVANNDTYTTIGSSTLIVSAPGVLGNDTDPSGLPLTANLVTSPLHGVLTFNADGSFSYAPTAGYTGQDSFSYKASDGSSLSNTATVTLLINPSSPAPVAVNDSYATTAGAVLTVSAPGVLGNDSDPSGKPISVVLVSNTTNGILSINADGSFTYTPNAGFTGSDSFSYRDSDGSNLSNVATVNLTVNAAPLAPTANNDSYTTTADTTLTVVAPGVLGNDTDPNGRPLTANLVTSPSHGVLTFNSNGSFTYAPTAGYVGSDSFSYKASDGLAISNTATISLLVNPAASAPVAVNDSYTATAGSVLSVTAPGVLSNDTDPNNHALNTVLVSSTTHGVLIFNSNGSFTYTPTAGFTGSDSFSYRDSNGSALSNVATVFLTVNAAPQAPNANNDAYTTTVNATLTVGAPGVLGNDTDPNGRPLTANLVSGPSHGTLTFNSDGSFSYAPANGFTGQDSFSYQASDGLGVSQTATVSLTVNLGTLTPVANDDFYNATSGSILTVSAPGTLGNDTDPNGRPLTANLVANPSHGTLVFNPDGSFTYAPAAGYVGNDSFSYKASDGLALSNTATVSLLVNPGSSAPVAVNDSYTATAGSVLSVTAPGVLSNDTDPNGRPLTAVLVSNPLHGVLSINSDGSFLYTPTAGYTGSDGFSYRDSDGSALSNVATVSLLVNPAASAPVAVNDSYNATAGSILSVTAPGVLGNDTDPNGRPLTAVLVTSPSHGVLSINPDGSFFYTPTAGYTGSDSFSYRDSDGTALSNVATVVLTVNTASQAPTANNDTYSVVENSLLTVNTPGVLSNDTDPNGQPLTAVIVTSPTHGSLTFNSDGSFSYAPAAGYVGADNFSYKANDGNALSNTATVTINTTNPQPTSPPVGVDDQYATNAGTTLAVPTPGVLNNDTDPNNLPLSAVLVSNVSHGTLSFNDDGSFIYVPTAGYVGTDGFTYQDSDGTTLGNLVTVTLNVNATTQPPVVNPDIYTATAGKPLVVAAPGVQANDSDPSGKPLTSTIVSQPSHGTLVLQPDGSFTYQADPSYHGIDSFTYQDSDGTSTSGPATVFLAVYAASPFPAADDRAFVGSENQTLTVVAPGLLDANEIASGLTLTPSVVTQPAHGTLTLSLDNSFVYVPNQNFSGVDTFTYTFTDGTQVSNVATVSLLIVANDSVPIFNPNPPVTPSGGSSLINLTVATFTITDPNVSISQYSATIDWGDGTAKSAGTIVPIPGGFAVQGSHQYSTNGMYAITVTVDGPDGTQTNQTALMEITSPDVALQAGLDPATDTGTSDTDYITSDTSPAFIGTATPGDLITLTTTLPGQTTQQVVGTAYVADDGTYRVVSNILTDGSYDFTVEDSDPDTAVVEASWNSPQLLVDTTSPVVSNVQLVPGQGMILVTFQDAGGLDQSDLANVDNYVVSRAFAPYLRTMTVTSAVPGPIEADGTQTVALFLNGGQTIGHARLVLRVIGSAIKDLAGNDLDGTFNGQFPSGNGTPGTNFSTKLVFNSYQVLKPEAVTYIPALHYTGQAYGLYNNHGSPYLTRLAKNSQSAMSAVLQRQAMIASVMSLARQTHVAPATILRNQAEMATITNLARQTHVAPAVVQKAPTRLASVTNHAAHVRAHYSAAQVTHVSHATAYTHKKCR